MFNRTHLLLLFALILMSYSSFAQDLKIKKCKWGLINILNEMEIKGAAPLEITEYHLSKPIDHIFGDRILELAPLESRMKERMAVFRNPHVSKAVRDNAFAQTKLISEASPEDFVKQLKPNTIYTYTIQDKKISFAQTKPGKIRDFASKHALLSADKEAGPLRMAGEMWVDEKGILHFDPGSGTYKPGAEDLKRAAVFFQDHLGLKNSVPHYFEPQVAAVAERTGPAAASGIMTKVKQLDIGVMATRVKRNVIGATKYTSVTKARLQEMQALENETITLIDPNNQEIKYKVMRLETMVREETIFDTEDLKLHSKQISLQRSKTFNMKDEGSVTKPTAIDERSLASGHARRIAGDSPLIPVAKTRNEVNQLGFFRVTKTGVSKDPAFILAMETKKSEGLAGKIKDKDKETYSASVEHYALDMDKNEKYQQLITTQLEKRFSLNRTASQDQSKLISELEKTSVGQ